MIKLYFMTPPETFSSDLEQTEILRHDPSLVRFIEFLGGDASFEARIEIFDKALADGLMGFAERTFANKPEFNASELEKDFAGLPSQNMALLLFLRLHIVIGDSYWDVESNYLLKPDVEQHLDLEEELELFVATSAGFELDATNPNNRFLALCAAQDFLERHPQMSELSIEFVHRLMGNMSNNMITIDDGPNENTPEILDILEEAGVTAIFYLIGKNVRQHPDHVRMIAERGHIIGYHTMDHVLSQQGDIYNPRYLEKDFMDFKRLINDVLGVDYPILFFRAPGGWVIPRKAFDVSKEAPISPFATVTYLPKGTGLRREDNWDVYDDSFRERGTWHLLDPQGKTDHYIERYSEGRDQVFLLHQESDDVETLRAMF